MVYSHVLCSIIDKYPKSFHSLRVFIRFYCVHVWLGQPEFIFVSAEKNWSEHAHLIAFATVAHTHTCHSSFISSNSEYKIDILAFSLFVSARVQSSSLVHVVISLFRMRLFRSQPQPSCLSHATVCRQWGTWAISRFARFISLECVCTGPEKHPVEYRKKDEPFETFYMLTTHERIYSPFGCRWQPSILEFIFFFLAVLVMVVTAPVAYAAFYFIY